MKESANHIAEGDLSNDMEALNSKDELGDLNEALQKMVGNLRDIVGYSKDISTGFFLLHRCLQPQRMKQDPAANILPRR